MSGVVRIELFSVHLYILPFLMSYLLPVLWAVGSLCGFLSNA